MSFDFPNAPLVGQTANGYIWDGEKWKGGGPASGGGPAIPDGTVPGYLLRTQGPGSSPTWEGFLQLGTGAVTRTWQDKAREVVSVLDFGADRSGIGNSTAAFNAAFAASSAIVPPGTYTLNGDVQIPSNRYIWFQPGSFVTNTGGRFTGYVPGGGNITLQIDGVCAFPATLTGADLPGWEPNAGTATRGIIELGGTQAQPASAIRVFGCGHVYSDYVWPGSPPSSFFDMNYQLNRKGLCFMYANDTWADGLEFSNIYGECVYWQGYVGARNCKFTRLYVHDVAFNGLNFNAWGASSMLMAFNTVINAWQCIEMSVGTATHNTLMNGTSGIISGAGGGAGPMFITNNAIDNMAAGLTIEFGAPTTVERFSIQGNSISNIKGTAIFVGRISSFQIKNNILYNYANASPGGVAIQCSNQSSFGHIDGNIIRPGSFSTGNVLNQAGSANVVGTNPVFP